MKLLEAGASSGARGVKKCIAAARDGDVVIAHINQPTHSSGEGVDKGILALKAKGYVFVKLLDAQAEGSDGTADHAGS